MVLHMVVRWLRSVRHSVFLQRLNRDEVIERDMPVYRWTAQPALDATETVTTVDARMQSEWLAFVLLASLLPSTLCSCTVHHVVRFCAVTPVWTHLCCRFVESCFGASSPKLQAFSVAVRRLRTSNLSGRVSDVCQLCLSVVFTRHLSFESGCSVADWLTKGT